jgi:hypothetical protein
MQLRILHAISVAALLSTTMQHALATPIPYTYTLIAEGTPGAGTSLLTSGGLSAAINDDGTVAFVGTRRAGGTAIYTGSGGLLSTVVASGATYSGFSQIPVINDSGRVAFEATLTAGGAGVFTALAGGAVTTIAQGAGGLAGFGSNASMNNAGTVVFATANGIVTGNGGALTTVLAPSASVMNLANGVPDINDLGAIAFSARINGRTGIFRIETGVVTTISDEAGPFSSAYSSNPSINDSGTVAFGGIPDAGFPTGRETASGSGGAVATIASSSGQLTSNMSNPAINDNGEVAFFAGIDGGGAGIFTGNDIIDDAVVKVGQSLFGSTVTQLMFQGGDGINDFGDIAFVARLADGRFTVVRANAPRPVEPVPAPGGAAVGLALAALLGLRSWRRQSAGGANM